MSKNSSSNKFVYVVSALAALAGLLLGYDTGVISGAILFIREDFHLSVFQVELVISALLLGALIGAIISGRITDQFGRRKVLLGTAGIFVFGSLFTAFSSNVSYLIIGRLILGAAIGIGSYIAPLYLAEIAPQRTRGVLVSLNQLALTIGIVFSYLIDYYFATTGRWPWMLGLGVVPAVILLCGALFLPESPRWMILRGLDQDALDVLKKIRAASDVEQEFNEIKQTIVNEKPGDWRLLFGRWIRPILIISIGLSIFQQITGINTIIYYAPSIFKLAGFKEAGSTILATLGVGIVNVLFTIAALPLIDRWGRRPLLLFGLVGMFISLVVMSVAFHYVFSFPIAHWIVIAGTITYIASFAISLGPVVWLIISEIFPLQIRGIGASIAIAANWGFNLLVSLTFLTLVDLLGLSLTFCLYAVLCIITWIFVYLIVPETKGCSLEQIEANLRAGKASRKLGV